jgi:hypothetical protein
MANFKHKVFLLIAKWIPVAVISNWFEDEDASSDKVWEYFRVI